MRTPPCSMTRVSPGGGGGGGGCSARHTVSGVASISNENSWRCTSGRYLYAVELEHLDGVAPQHLVGDLLVVAGEHLLDVGLRVRPRRVGVRGVGFEADVVGAGLVDVLLDVTVGGEAAEDASVVIARRRFGDALAGVLPTVVVLPDRVGPFEDVGNPADLAL